MLLHAAGIRVPMATANKRGFENGSETPWTSLDCVINHVESHDNASFIVVSTNISCFFPFFFLSFLFFPSCCFLSLTVPYIFLMASFNFTPKKREFPVRGRRRYYLSILYTLFLCVSIMILHLLPASNNV